jgi:hypothetical protein
MIAEQDGKRQYTHIDFERSREDTLESLLFKRWAQSGIYDHTGNSHPTKEGRKAEDALLDAAYTTIETLHTIEGKEQPSRQEFTEEFRIQKKKHLLRLARRYKGFQYHEKKYPERLRANKRFFYTLFVYELTKEGKVVGLDDPQLKYLNTLFEEPLTLEAMKEISERHNPSFSSQEEISPLDVKDVKSTIDGLVDQYRTRRNVQTASRWAVRIGALALIAGVAVAGHLGYKAYQETDTKREEATRSLRYKERVETLFRIDGAQKDTIAEIGERHLRVLEERLGDKKTARAAYIDYYPTYEAIQESNGRTDWKTVGEYLRTHNIELYFTATSNEGYIDNFVWYPDSGKYARENADKIEAEAAEKYKAKKAAEAKASEVKDVRSPTPF